MRHGDDNDEDIYLAPLDESCLFLESDQISPFDYDGNEDIFDQGFGDDNWPVTEEDQAQYPLSPLLDVGSIFSGSLFDEQRPPPINDFVMHQSILGEKFSSAPNFSELSYDEQNSSLAATQPQFSHTDTTNTTGFIPNSNTRDSFEQISLLPLPSNYFLKSSDAAEVDNRRPVSPPNALYRPDNIKSVLSNQQEELLTDKTTNSHQNMLRKTLDALYSAKIESQATIEMAKAAVLDEKTWGTIFRYLNKESSRLRLRNYGFEVERAVKSACDDVASQLEMQNNSFPQKVLQNSQRTVPQTMIKPKPILRPSCSHTNYLSASDEFQDKLRVGQLDNFRLVNSKKDEDEYESDSDDEEVGIPIQKKRRTHQTTNDFQDTDNRDPMYADVDNLNRRKEKKKKKRKLSEESTPEVRKRRYKIKESTPDSFVEFRKKVYSNSKFKSLSIDDQWDFKKELNTSLHHGIKNIFKKKSPKYLTTELKVFRQFIQTEWQNPALKNDLSIQSSKRRRRVQNRKLTENSNVKKPSRRKKRKSVRRGSEEKNRLINEAKSTLKEELNKIQKILGKDYTDFLKYCSLEDKNIMEKCETIGHFVDNCRRRNIGDFREPPIFIGNYNGLRYMYIPRKTHIPKYIKIKLTKFYEKAEKKELSEKRSEKGNELIKQGEKTLKEELDRMQKEGVDVNAFLRSTRFFKGKSSHKILKAIASWVQSHRKYTCGEPLILYVPKQGSKYYMARAVHVRKCLEVKLSEFKKQQSGKKRKRDDDIVNDEDEPDTKGQKVVDKSTKTISELPQSSIQTVPRFTLRPQTTTRLPMQL